MMSWATKLSGAKKVIGMKPWETHEFGPLHVTAVPAIHWDISLGYVICSVEKCVYFTGDTFYGGFMYDLGRRFSLDAALLPVATPRLPMTMGENSAVKAVAALNTKVVIPIHLGLIPRPPLLQTGESPEGFRQRQSASGSVAKVVILPDGEALNL